MSIEEMRWWHVAGVAEAEVAVFPDDPWSVEQFWQELAQDTRAYLVATDDDAIAGYAGAFIMAPDSDLQTIAVSSTHQGRGLARRLLTALIERATGAGCTHMLLEVRDDNSRAIDLYERMEFERISERPRYYADGAAAIIMRRRLQRVP